MTLNAKLYHYHIQDIVKIKKSDYYKELELDIGISGDEQEATDRFSLVICTLEGMTEVYREHIKVYSMAQFDHILIVENLDEKEIVSRLKKRIEAVRGKSWEDISQKLAVFLNYEFLPNVPSWENILTTP